MSAQTPMLRQYFELKSQYPGTLLFFRMGDFYEMFFEDAITGARELEITLTARNKEKAQPVPMCGVPHHAAAGYIARLVKKGYRVALCEQTEDPAQAKGLVKRDVVRVITPGTALDPQLVESRETIFLAAICGTGDYAGAAFLELSTGEFRATQSEGKDCWEKIKADLESYAPREILYPNSLELLVKNLLTEEHAESALLLNTEQSAKGKPQAAFTLTGLEDWQWTADGGELLLQDQFRAQTLAGYGLSGKGEAIRAAGACLRYAQETQKAAAAHITDISFFAAQDHLVLDSVTVRNLELTATQSGQRGHSLFAVIDQSVTGMGARTLKAWLLRPSIKRGEVDARLDAVAELHASQMKRDRVRVLLKEIADLERLTGRLNMNNATPRDLLALARSLQQVPALRSAISPASSSLLGILAESLDELPDARDLIVKAIDPDAPARLVDGGIIRGGYNAEMDELRGLSGDAKAIIAALEARERSRTNIQSLRIKFNQVFGYYIEISKSNLARAPEDYERRQTLANAERFTTPELKELESKVLGAEERITQLEAELFGEVCRVLVASTKRLQTTARALATLDALASLAETAALYNYSRPQMHDGDEIVIHQGRHPVIEATNANPFIPNDVFLNNSTDRLLIITGPNMGGKCLAGDSLVFTDNGLMRIAVLQPETAQIGEFTEINCQVKALTKKLPATHFFTGGRQQTLKLTTRYGFALEGTPEHKVWVRRTDGGEGWCRLGALQIGDMIAIDRQIDLWGRQTQLATNIPKPATNGIAYHLPDEINEDLGYLLGLLIGDGSLTQRNSFALTTADEFIANEFRRIVQTHFGYTIGKPIKNITFGVSSKQIRDFLAALGLGFGRSPEKYVPASILRAPRNIVIAFLQGLFDTDGWAANSQAKVFLATSSPQLAQEVQMLLLNCGIVASLRVKQTAVKPSHQLAIYGAEALEFYRQIGFRLPRKQARQALASTIRRPNFGIPHLAGTLKQVQQKIVATSGKRVSLKKDKHISSIFYTYPRLGRNVSYNKLAELIQYCHLNGVACLALESVLERRYCYLPVTAIEPSEADVFDLSVAHEHAYVANGLVSHNSSILRQTALICLLAQMGSFVPATEARLPLLDRIWTRVGASDDLASGRSTFMVEMTETAAILHNATPRSLVILDEIGRGTSTFDGLSIAWAVAEYLHDAPEHAAKTLFATHYHELTELAERLPGAQNYQVTATERDGEVVFLYKLERGRASKSYGIAVAQLAGLPPTVLARAREVLERLERYELDVFAEAAIATPDEKAVAAANDGKWDWLPNGKTGEAANPKSAPTNEQWQSWAQGDAGLKTAATRAQRRRIASQATLFDAVNQDALDDIREANVENLSETELRALLADVRRRIV